MELGFGFASKGNFVTIDHRKIKNEEQKRDVTMKLIFLVSSFWLISLRALLDV